MKGDDFINVSRLSVVALGCVFCSSTLSPMKLFSQSRRELVMDWQGEGMEWHLEGYVWGRRVIKGRKEGTGKFSLRATVGLFSNCPVPHLKSGSEMAKYLMKGKQKRRR